MTPSYGQVNLYAPEATDFPIPDTGLEPAVANESALSVMTRGFLDGDVTFHVVLDSEQHEMGDSPFECDLSFPSGTVLFGDYISNNLCAVQLAQAGKYHALVQVDNAELPGEVWVYLSKNSDCS